MIRWAVSGTGNMASLFVEDGRQVRNGKFTSVYSGSLERANAFAEEHQLDNAYGDIDEMLADDSIDAVYIASTHPNHAPQAIAALNAGKHVLVEKPMALSEAQAEEVFAAALRNKCFCAEALWTKFSPVFQSLNQHLKAQRIGQVRHINANFGFVVDMTKPKQRLLNPDQAGGALLDIGLYPIMLPLSIWGYPDKTIANIQIGQTGVDVCADLIMSYNSGASATVSYRFDCNMPVKAHLSGNKGWVEIESPWFASNALHWWEQEKAVSTEYFPMLNRGWGHEFMEVNDCILKGQVEASVHTWNDSLQLAKYLEFLRNTWGPTFPFE